MSSNVEQDKPASETPETEPVRAEMGLAGFGLLLVFLLVFAVRFPLLHVPLERDEGGYAYSAWVWSEGGLPYRDAFDNKPPLLILIYRTALAVFGSTPEAPHLALIAFSLLSAWLLYKLAKRFMDEGPALLAVAAFTLLSAEPSAGVGNAANSEAFMLAPILASAYFLPSSALASGIFIGCAMMIKQTALFEAVFFGFCLALLAYRERNDWERLGRYALGALMVPSMFLAYFWGRGAMPQFLECVFFYNTAYGSEAARTGMVWMGIQELFYNIKETAPAEWGIWALALMSVSSEGRRLPGMAWAWAWFGFSFLAVSAGLRFMNHYFVQLAPALSLLTGLGVSAVLQRIPERVKERTILVLAACVLFLPYLISNRWALSSGKPEDISRKIYDINPFVESVPLATYIRETTKPEDKVYVFGSEPQVLFLSKRHSATRFIQFSALTSDYKSAREMQLEAIAEIEASKPEVVVWIKIPLSHMAKPHSRTEILHYSNQLVAPGRYTIEGLVFAETGKPSRYLFGMDKLKGITPSDVESAIIVLYRKSRALPPHAHGRDPALKRPVVDLGS
jgi:hypothetical protein